MTVDLFDNFANVFHNLGLAGVVILSLVAALGIVWRELQKERQRSAGLVDTIILMTKEALVAIERIAGR